MLNLEEAIRERAYHLWIADGQPEGKADIHWLNAQREILATSVESLARSPNFKHIIAWFRPKDWEELKLYCPGDLQDTYEEWYEDVQRRLDRLGVTEDEIEKSILTPDHLRNWQAASGGKIDSRARALLAVELAIRRGETRH